MAEFRPLAVTAMPEEYTIYQRDPFGPTQLIPSSMQRAQFGDGSSCAIPKQNATNLHWPQIRSYLTACQQCTHTQEATHNKIAVSTCSWTPRKCVPSFTHLCKQVLTCRKHKTYNTYAIMSHSNHSRAPQKRFANHQPLVNRQPSTIKVCLAPKKTPQKHQTVNCLAMGFTMRSSPQQQLPAPRHPLRRVHPRGVLHHPLCVLVGLQPRDLAAQLPGVQVQVAEEYAWRATHHRRCREPPSCRWLQGKHLVEGDVHLKNGIHDLHDS